MEQLQMDLNDIKEEEITSIKIKRIKEPLIPCYKEHLKKLHENIPKYIPNKRSIKNET